MKKATKKVIADVPAALRLRIIVHNANRHLGAYKIDGNPQHIVDAYFEFRKHNIAFTPGMLRYLDKLFEDLKFTTGHRARTNTARDIDMYVAALRGDSHAVIANRFKLKRENVKTIVARMRDAVEHDAGVLDINAYLGKLPRK